MRYIAVSSLIIELTSVTEAEFYLSEVAEYFLKYFLCMVCIWTGMNLNQTIADWICFCVFQRLRLCFRLWCFPVRLRLWKEIWLAPLLEVAEAGKWRRTDYMSSPCRKTVGGQFVQCCLVREEGFLPFVRSRWRLPVVGIWHTARRVERSLDKWENISISATVYNGIKCGLGLFLSFFSLFCF